MNFIPFFGNPNSAKPATITIYRASDGVKLWTAMFQNFNPIPRPGLELDLKELERWGGYKVRLEWSE